MRRRKPDGRNPHSPSQPGRKAPDQRSEHRGKDGGRPAGKSHGKPGHAGKAHGKPASRPDDRRDDRRAPPRAAGKSGARSDSRNEQRGSGDFRPQKTTPGAFGRPDRPQRPNRADRPERQDRQDRPPRFEAEASGRADRHPAQRQGRFGHAGRPDLPVWLYGVHACLAALNNPDRYLRRLLVTREALAELGDDLPAQPQPETVDRLRLDAVLPPGAVHQGIAVLADPLEDPGVESLAAAPEADDTGEAEAAASRDMVLVLDHVTDPRNVGAILRSAAAFGARAVIVTDRHAPEATGALAKAASGGLEVVPLIRVTNLARALDLLAEYGYWRVGLEMETDKTLAEAVGDLRRVALVLGAEDEGLRRLTREKCDFLAKLPMSGAVESLNVSAAAAVAMYECARG